MIHIICGTAAKAGLQFALRGSNDLIIGFPTDFALGPIRNIHKKSGVKRRFRWLKDRFDPTWYDLDDDELEFKQALNDMLTIENGTAVTIWTSENAHEQTGLRVITYLLQGKTVELSMVNTYHAMKDYMKRENVNIDLRHTGECNATQFIAFLENNLNLISEDLRASLEEKGRELIESTEVVRTWKGHDIVYDSETRDDVFILHCANNIQGGVGKGEYILVARLIGEVLGHTECYLSDAWIEYRIRSLIDSEKLQYKE